MSLVMDPPNDGGSSEATEKKEKAAMGTEHAIQGGESAADAVNAILDELSDISSGSSSREEADA